MYVHKGLSHLLAATLVAGLATASLVVLPVSTVGASPTGNKPSLAQIVANVNDCLHGGYVKYETTSGKPFTTELACVIYSLFGGALVVKPTPLLITASSTTTTYGSGPPVVTPIYTPSISSPLTTPPTCTSTVTATTAVGTYAGANTCSGGSDPAYIITYAPGTAAVGTAPLTVTASSGSFVQGGAPPTITPEYSGFQNGQGSSAFTTQPTCSTTATSSSTPATYPSTCAGAVDPNYAFTYLPGTITVIPQP
jgi:hypothetical protein